MVVHAYYPVGEPRVEREAKAALQAGYRVDVVCLRRGEEPKQEIVDGIEIHRVGVVHRRGASSLKMLGEYLAFALLASVVTARLRYRHRRAGGHTVQVHAPPEFLVLAGLVPKLFGSRLVLDIHDLSKHLYGARYGASSPLARILGLGLSLTERVSCALADQVITVHEPYRSELISNRIRSSRITVVMNAADEAVIAQATSNGSNGARPAPVEAPFTIAYHGTITPSYGVDLIVEALPSVLERVPDTRCVILGEGDALPEIKARAEALGVVERIEFSGRYLPIVDALRRVAGAQCGVIPNRPTHLNRFALSSKLFEYVAMEVPAVVARLETLAHYFDAADVNFFEAGDPESLAGAITWVALNRDEALAKAARAKARGGQCSWTEQRVHYLGVLERA